MVMRFDFEGAGPAIADINHAGVFTRPLQHAARVRGQPLQMRARRFIGAVLAPHHAEDAKFGQGWGAAESALDLLVFLAAEAVLLDDFRSNRLGRGCGGESHAVIVAWPARRPPRQTYGSEISWMPPEPHCCRAAWLASLSQRRLS